MVNRWGRDKVKMNKKEISPKTHRLKRNMECGWDCSSLLQMFTFRSVSLWCLDNKGDLFAEVTVIKMYGIGLNKTYPYIRKIHGEFTHSGWARQRSGPQSFEGFFKTQKQTWDYIPLSRYSLSHLNFFKTLKGPQTTSFCDTLSSCVFCWRWLFKRRVKLFVSVIFTAPVSDKIKASETFYQLSKGTQKIRHVYERGGAEMRSAVLDWRCMTQTAEINPTDLFFSCNIWQTFQLCLGSR